MNECDQAAQGSEHAKAPESGSAPHVGDAAAEPGPFAHERVGPLRIERTHKDDGRSLILYWEAERAH